MTRLSDDEVEAACAEHGIDPAWVLAIDVTVRDLVIVLRIPIAELGRLTELGDQA